VEGFKLDAATSLVDRQVTLLQVDATCPARLGAVGRGGHGEEGSKVELGLIT
jgi:hypothetical protein